MHRTLAFSCTAALAAALPQLAEAQAFTITRSVIANGGGSSSGGVFSVTGTTGETASGSPLCYGGRFDLASGFWAGRPAVRWPEARSLGAEPVFSPGGDPIWRYGVEWSPSRPGWQVEMSTSLSAWTPLATTIANEPARTLYFFGTGPTRVPATYWRLKRL